MPKYDVFISYARADRSAVQRIEAALIDAKLSVFRDQNDIPEFAPISPHLRDGLSQAKVLLAYYSPTYPQRRACQWELTAAVIAGEGEAAVQRRVLVVNPLATVDHIEPGTLRHRLSFSLPSADDDAALAELAAKVRAHVDGIDAPMTVRLSARPRRVGGVWGRSPNRFVGRLPEMWDIHTNLCGDTVLLTSDGTAPSGGHSMTQVQAWGGMGKSLLAEEYGRRFEPAWPGGLFWLSAGGPDTSATNWQARVEAQLINVIIDLAPDTDILALRQGLKDLAPETRVLVVRARAGQLLERLEQLYLWVVDDLPHHTLTTALEAWAAPTSGGRTLFTTRDRGLSGVGKIIHLGVLKPDQAYRLLTAARVPEGDAEEAAARQIVERLGSYPLAIDVAGQIADTFTSFVDMLEVVSSPSMDSKVLAHELEAELPNGHASNIVATLQYSFQHACGKHPQALTVLRTLACLAPQTGVPLDLLSSMVGEDAGDAATLLRRLSLLDLENGAATVHQIIARAIALDSPPTAMAAAKASAVKVFTRVMKVAVDIREHKGLTPLLPHVEALTERTDSAEEAWLLGCLGQYQLEAGRAALAEPLFRREGEVLQKILGGEHRSTLICMSNLASTVAKQGNYAEAKVLMQQVVQAECRILGAEHPDTLISMNNLAMTLLNLGDYAGAQVLHEQVLEVRRRVLGADDPDVWCSMNNLALALGEQGDHAGARALQEQTLEVRHRVMGAEHPQTLVSMNNLAGTLGAQGDHAGARALQEQVVETERHVLGTEHPTRLGSMNNLALTLGAQGDHAGAQVIHEQVLEARCRILGVEHPHTLNTRGNLGLALAAQGDHAGAQVIHEQVLEARHRVMGAEHPDTLNSMNSLALTLAAQGDHAGAQVLQEKILKVIPRILGAEHPHTLTSMHNLALTLGAQGDNAGARVLYEQALEAQRRVLGPEHLNTLTTAANLAIVHLKMDDAEGVDLLLGTLEGYRRVMPEHPYMEALEGLVTRILDAAKSSETA